jgi:7-keto-8-aminopelargonate synthetase-like enzyme
MAPPVAAAALAALQQLKAEPERVARLREAGKLFLDLARQAGLDTGGSAGYSVIPVIVGSSLKSVMLSNALFERGINVPPIIHPAIPERAARLRFFICCSHSQEQIRQSVKAVEEEFRKLADISV